MGRKALPLTPAAVCASPPGGYITAIAPILTKTPLIKNRGLTAYNRTAGLVPKTQALPLS